jgi:hypothetical protein
MLDSEWDGWAFGCISIPAGRTALEQDEKQYHGYIAFTKGLSAIHGSLICN